MALHPYGTSPPQFILQNMESLMSHFRILSTDTKVSLSFLAQEPFQHLNGDTWGFHPHTQKLEPPCTA